MSAVASPRWDREVRLLAGLAVCVSVFSFLFYFRRGDVLLYGDAVAHINIARRVFDSKTPGLLQLGTVWLPLPHLLMIPFLISDEMWIRGVGGSIPSMAAYVFGVIGIFRLVRGTLSCGMKPGADVSARVAAWTAALVFGANPNLIYMQTTAMGEAVYLALFIWAAVYFSEFVQGDSRAIVRCGWCLMAACLTRYDRWFLAAGMVVGIAMVVGRSPLLAKDARNGAPRFVPSSRVAIVKFVLLGTAAPVFWFGYNAAVYRNPLEFANGPYSAKAIEQRTGTINPAKNDLGAAWLYFFKAAQKNLGEGDWQHVGAIWFVLGCFSTIVVVRKASVFWWFLLPLPFYALSIAYGRVPLFVPEWWPFSLYNVRYGLELLPAFAVMCGVIVTISVKPIWPTDRFGTVLRWIAILGTVLVLAGSYVSIWQAQPICYREAAINAKGRMILERQLASWLKALPPDATLLMYLGAHPGAVQQAGIPLRHVINEGNHRVWMQPSDPEGLWERALANPSQFADYAVAFENDPVWQAVQGRHLKELVEVKTTGQPRAILYQTR